MIVSRIPPAPDAPEAEHENFSLEVWEKLALEVRQIDTRGSGMSMHWKVGEHGSWRVSAYFCVGCMALHGELRIWEDSRDLDALRELELVVNGDAISWDEVD